MAIWSNFAGTVTGFIRLGLTGVRLKGIAGGLAVRTAADTADANITAATGTFAAIDTTGANTWSSAQRGGVTALTSATASTAINLASNNNFTYATLESSTLAAPTAPVAGQSGVIVITQGATAFLLAYNTFWKFPGGTIPTLTATAGAVDTFAYYVESATRATCRLMKGIA